MRLFLLPLCVALLAGVSRAEEPAPAQATANKEDKSTPTKVEETSTTNGTRSRAMSTALTAGIRYAPPPPESTVIKEPEKPKNDIVRLPKVTVQGSKPPIFSDRALREQAQRDKFSVKKYLSEFDRGVLNSVSGPSWTNFSNEKRAEQMAYDENRKQTLETIDQQTDMYEATGDERRAKEAQEDKFNTTLRSSDPFAPKDGSKWYGELR